jgi:hypothetical protein
LQSPGTLDPPNSRGRHRLHPVHTTLATDTTIAMTDSRNGVMIDNRND